MRLSLVIPVGLLLACAISCALLVEQQRTAIASST
jgi:hypothetical protein